MSYSLGPLRAAAVAQGNLADNAISTASVAGAKGVVHHSLGFSADYSAAVAAIKTITFKKGSTTSFVLRHDFTLGNLLPVALPVAVRGDEDGAVSVELEASGTGGVTGRVNLFYFSE